MKLIDDKTAAEIHERVNGWTNGMFPHSSLLGVKEFLANEVGMTFYTSLVTEEDADV